MSRNVARSAAAKPATETSATASSARLLAPMAVTIDQVTSATHTAVAASASRFHLLRDDLARLAARSFARTPLGSPRCTKPTSWAAVRTPDPASIAIRKGYVTVRVCAGHLEVGVGGSTTHTLPSKARSSLSCCDPTTLSLRFQTTMASVPCLWNQRSRVRITRA